MLKTRDSTRIEEVTRMTVDTRQRLMDIAVENLSRFIAGTPVNVVKG